MEPDPIVVQAVWRWYGYAFALVASLAIVALLVFSLAVGNWSALSLLLILPIFPGYAWLIARQRTVITGDVAKTRAGPGASLMPGPGAAPFSGPGPRGASSCCARI